MTSTTIAAAIALVNQGEYRAALLAFEHIWHAERSESLRALILLCNALHQLQLGLVTAPRRNLDTAIKLLEAGASDIPGLPMADTLTTIRAVRAAIPADLETGSGRVEWETIPHVVL